MRPSSLYTSLAIVGLVALSIETGGTQAPAASPQVSQTPAPADQPAGRGQGRRGGGGAGQVAGRGRGAETPPWAILRAPAGTKEGATWVPEMPPMEALAPPPGWKPDGLEVPWIPATLLRIPRTNITRAKYPAIDFHNHTGALTTREQYEAVVKSLDGVGVGAVVNLNGGTGDQLDAVLKAGEPYRDRVANFVTFSGTGINEPGWSERFAALMERGFKGGAMGMKVSKQLGQGVQNPDGSFIQADDPRLDPIWAMAAKYKKPVMIHTSDSIGRFYPISVKNERYEAGLWHQPGDESGNLYKTGPKPEVIERARENMHRKHPNTIFVNAHMAMLYYDPAKLAKFLDTYPNAQVEISAAVQDLGRAPRLWREFLIKYQDRVLFGTDGRGNSDPDTFWNPHFRYLETYDEYFEHPAQIRLPGGSPGHGRWNISGVSLPDEVLRKIYYENALKYLPTLRASIERQRAARK
jgi:predicted TIM-barrel fold metal-dependent hydrolase